MRGMRGKSGRICHIVACNSANKVGMTLVEILVALALLSIVFGLVILPFTKSFDLLRRARIAGSLESAIMLTMRQIKSDLSRAWKVVLKSQSPCNRIDIYVRDARGEDTQITYYIKQYSNLGALYRKDPLTENAITPLDGTDLAGLRFWHDGVSKTIIVDIKLQKVDPTIRVRGGGKLLIRRQIRIRLAPGVEVSYQ